MVAYSTSSNPARRCWHERLGYIGPENLQKLAAISPGLDLDHIPDIDIQHHWIREKIAGGEIKLEYVHTSRQIADGLTKPLPKDTFYAFRKALGVRE